MSKMTREERIANWVIVISFCALTVWLVMIFCWAVG